MPRFVPRLSRVGLAALCVSTASAQDLFVCSPETDSIKRYDWRTGDYLGDFITAGSGGLDFPTAIAFGDDGDLYVGSGPNAEILRYDGKTGAFKETFIDNMHFQGGPSDMKFRDGKLYVTQWNNSAPLNGGVLVYDAETGNFIEQLVSGVSRTNALAFGADGRLYVSEFARHRVNVYDPETGDEVGRYGTGATISGAMGVSFDPDGNLLIGSWGEGAVKRFDLGTGDLIDTVVTGLDNTIYIANAPDGTLIIDDHNNDRLGRYDAETGEFLNFAAIGGGLLSPEKFTFGPIPSPGTGVILGIGVFALSRRRR